MLMGAPPGQAPLPRFLHRQLPVRGVGPEMGRYLSSGQKRGRGSLAEFENPSMCNADGRQFRQLRPEAAGADPVRDAALGEKHRRRAIHSPLTPGADSHLQG